MGKGVMTIGTILKNGKRIIIATFHAYIAIFHDFINSYNMNQMGTITWGNGNTNVSLHIVNRI